MEEPLIRFSWASFARKNPLSSRRSVPTTDNATWCPTPAAASWSRRLRVDVSKNFSTAASSHEGEFVTSTTTEAPFSASASPSPVMLLTPVLGAAATASCRRSRNLLTSFDPISPVPPTTTIFMIVPSFLRAHFQSARLTRYDQIAIPHFWRNSLGFAPVFRRGDCRHEYRLGHTFRSVAADIARHFTSVGRTSNRHGVLQIQLMHRYSSKGASINKSTAEIGL